MTEHVYNIGDSASLTRRITQSDLDDFARLSGDVNPLHLDDEYASTTAFQKRIAHGLLVASLISTVIGTKLPGFGSIYLNQSLGFKKPVYIGDVVTALVSVKEIREGKNIYILNTQCTNQDGVLVLEGEATVLFRRSQ